MLKVEVKNLAGEKVEELELKVEIFGLKTKHDLVSQVYNSIAANMRFGLSHTKNKAERAGSNAKPWKQKGTGRARTGSVRNPIWRKGGVIFGPRKDRNWSQKVNQSARRQAIKMVLSGKLASKELVVVDSYSLKENKTKLMAQALQSLKVDRKAVLAFTKEESLWRRYSRNLEKVENREISRLNVYDMLNAKYLVLTKEGVKFLEEKYLQA